MNRKTSIIISITGITIIALILISFTYGYYLTRIDGNENSKSVSITIGEMSVNYTDLSQETLSAIIEPGYETYKMFTVENTGNVRGIYSIYLTDVINEFVRTDDIEYTLYRKLNDSIEELNDEDIIATGKFPKTNAYIITNEILENPNDYYTYALKITYINSTENQNDDQGHTFSGKVEIHAIPTSPYETGTLANAIFNNSVKPTTEEVNKGYATFTVPTLTQVASEINNETESILSSTNDEYGTSYYYRGTVKNNYLTFNNMCWRIVRIEGDGAIKIVLADDEAGCSASTLTKTDSAFIGAGNYGYDENNKADYENSQNRTTSMKYKFNEWFNTNLSNVSNKLKTTTICIGETSNKYDDSGNLLTDSQANELGYWYYDNYKRLNNGKTASLVCNSHGGRTTSTQIYPLTADEVVYAGGKIQETNYTYYLIENATSDYWWTLSPVGFNGNVDYIFRVDYDGCLSPGDYVTTEYNLRPAVSLISSTLILSGDGSINNPYTIK